MQDCEPDQLISADDDSSCVDIQRMSLESAIRQAGEAIVITSATGKIQFVNPAFTKMTGYRLDEVIGQFPSILKSGVQDPAYYEDLWRTILAGQVWHGELINRRKDGSLYTEELSITPVLTAGGRTSNYIAVKQDVTERRAAETARQFLAAIIESTEDAVVGSTLDGKILTWNRGAEKLHGYPADEAIGQSILMLLAPEYHEATHASAKVCSAAEYTPSLKVRRSGRMAKGSRLGFRCVRLETQPGRSPVRLPSFTTLPRPRQPRSRCAMTKRVSGWLSRMRLSACA